jgi:hypothetical protein
MADIDSRAIPSNQLATTTDRGTLIILSGGSTSSGSSDRSVANVSTTVIVFGGAHLCRILKAYASYYNEVRTNLSLKKNAPDFRRTQKIGRIAVISILAGCIISTLGIRF